MRTGPDRMLMISLVVSATFAATSLAQIDHCGMKLTIPQVETVFRYRFEAEGIDATKETRIELPQKVATAGAELSQVIELPETLGTITLRRYLQRAWPDQIVVPDVNGEASAAVELSFKGLSRSYKRWLIADDVQRNRLASMVGRWRYVATRNQAHRDRVFAEFKGERSRKPNLLVSGPDKSNPQAWTFEVGEKSALGTQGVSIRVLRFVESFTIDRETNEVTSASSEYNNPAVQIEFTDGDKSARRWVFAKFPDFNMHDGDAIAIHVRLDCPIHQANPQPDFVVVTIGDSSHEIWSRIKGSVAVIPVALGETVPVAETGYVFSITRFVPSGRLVETYLPSERSGAVTSLQVEFDDDKGTTQTVWLEAGKPSTMTTNQGFLTLGFGRKSATAANTQQPPHPLP